jgi:hypothetical protein
MAHAACFRNLRKRGRSASTLAGIFPMPAVRNSSPFSLGFAIPPLHAFHGGIFAGCALIGASTDMARFIE